MQAGFAEVIITPPDGRCFLAGYAGPWATGVHDDVHASAVYLDDGATTALLVSLDLIALEASLISRFKGAICRELAIAPEHIFFTCTHTHESPEVRQRKYYVRDGKQIELDYQEAYYRVLDDRLRSVASEAHTSARECDLFINRAYADENHNRRLFLNNGQFLGTPGHKELIPIAREYADKEVGDPLLLPARQPTSLWPDRKLHHAPPDGRQYLNPDQC